MGGFHFWLDFKVLHVFSPCFTHCFIFTQFYNFDILMSTVTEV